MKASAGKEQLSDADLLRLAGKHDEEAFLILYRRHQGPVFRFALHMSGSRETAEEVTQEVFLAMLAKRRGYILDRGSLQAYLMGIARNQVRRQLRQRRECAFESFDLRDLPSEFAARLCEDVNTRQQLLALRAAILRLPPNYREVVVLCDLEGLDYSSAAWQLNCATGTVRSRLHRARAILQTKLARKGEPRTFERCPA